MKTSIESSSSETATGSERAPRSGVPMEVQRSFAPAGPFSFLMYTLLFFPAAIKNIHLAKEKASCFLNRVATTAGVPAIGVEIILSS